MSFRGKIVKTKGKVFSALSTGLCALFLLCACNNQVQLEWRLTDVGVGVSGHTQAQAAYIAGDYTKISTYANGTKELSRPQSVNFSWSAEDNGAAVSAESYTVELSLSYDFTESIKYETDKTQIDIYNLLLDSTYFWRVTANLSGGKKSVSSTSMFTTSAAAPRNLYIDGITNARDLGGWKTSTGSVKQGMIYRCGRLNESKREDVKVEITDKGIREMKEVLGVKTEVDLRTNEYERGGITSSPLGGGVEYVNIPMEGAMGEDCITNEKFHPAIKQFFTLLANESNYPIAFHCDIGTDRTGFFAFLINGLVGVDENDLYRDYLFSNFGKIDTPRVLSNIDGYVNTIKNSEGSTLSEKIEYCLINTVGVDKAEIDAVRAIMTA